MSELTWTPVRVRLADLLPWEQNPKRMTQAQARKLETSTGKLGRAGVLLVSPPDGDGKRLLYDGHQRVKVWSTLYGATTEVVALEANRLLTDAERRATSLLTVTATASFDWDALAGWDAGELQDWGLDADMLAGWNDDAANLALLLEAEQAEPPADVEPQLDKAEELRAKWGVESGQLWQLGEHRLICGDCTDAAVVERVLLGETPLLMVTDLPYGVEYDANWRNEAAEKGLLSYAASRVGEVTNDDRADWSDAWRLFPGDVAYTWSPGGDHVIITGAALQASGFDIRAMLIWKKPHIPIGRGHYCYQHEPVWYAVKNGKTAHWIGGHMQSSVWEIALDKNVEGGHSTQKPLECMERPIRNHEGDVYDPFLGSGTTIIACERLGRKCRAVEIEPKYVAVAIQRWVDVTGGTPVLLDGSNTADNSDGNR